MFTRSSDEEGNEITTDELGKVCLFVVAAYIFHLLVIIGLAFFNWFIIIIGEMFVCLLTIIGSSICFLVNDFIAYFFFLFIGG